MRKFFRYISLILTVFSVICCFAVTAFAAADSFLDVNLFKNRLNHSGGNVIAEGYFAMTCRLPVGRYKVEFGEVHGSYYNVSYAPGIVDGVQLDRVEIAVQSGGVFEVTTDMLQWNGTEQLDYCWVAINSYSVEPSIHQLNVVDDTLHVSSSMFGWLAGAFGKITPLFYLPESGLTFFGYLAIGGVAVSAGFLLLALLQKWLRFGR